MQLTVNEPHYRMQSWSCFSNQVVLNGSIKSQTNNYPNLGKPCAEYEYQYELNRLLSVMYLLVARFANASKPVLVYSDETVAYTFRVLSKEKTGVAVIDRKNRRLIGMIQCSDVYLLLDDSSLFSNRKQVFFSFSSRPTQCLTEDNFDNK